MSQTHRYIYRVSGNSRINARERIEQNKLNKKVLYHFAILAIIIELLIKKDRPIRALILGRAARETPLSPRARRSGWGYAGYAHVTLHPRARAELFLSLAARHRRPSLLNAVLFFYHL